MALTPILVASSGRSGTTALMSLLGTDPHVAFDRVYPFENRYLTYYAKFAVVASRCVPAYPEPLDAMMDFDGNTLGPPPWPVEPPAGVTFATPSTPELLRGLWSVLVGQLPNFTHYAEKVPAWTPAVIRTAFPCTTLYLMRDPRDVYLSSVAFNRSRGSSAGFGWAHGMSERDHALNLAHGILTYWEKMVTDAGRMDVLTVRYEDLIGDTAAVADRLGKALGLDLSAQRMPPAPGEHRTSSDSASSISRWKRDGISPTVTNALESMLHDCMTSCNYPVSAPRAKEIDLSRCEKDSGDGSFNVDDEGITVQVQGGDFWVTTAREKFDAASVSEIWICARGNTGDHFALFWRSPREEFAETHSLRIPFASGDHFQILRFPVGGHPLWKGAIGQLRLDFFNGLVTSGQGGTVRWIRFVP
jgi:hypothetical protein